MELCQALLCCQPRSCTAQLWPVTAKLPVAAAPCPGASAVHGDGRAEPCCAMLVTASQLSPLPSQRQLSAQPAAQQFASALRHTGNRSTALAANGVLHKE